MSIDEKIEQEAYDAITKINAIPRAQERARICKNIIKVAATIAGYDIQFEEPHAPKS